LTVLVTGAAGFIGSAVSRALSDVGEQVLAVDSLSSYYSRELKSLRVQELLNSDSITFKACDLSNDLEVSNIFKTNKIEKVLHLAAQPGVRVNTLQSERYTKDNLVAFVNLITYAKEYKIEDFVYASSSSIYGNSNERRFNEIASIPSPVSFYGATKLSNEIIASAASREIGIRTRGLRFFTVYGPWGRPDMVYFRIGASVLNGKEFRLLGNGSVLRDFTYIDDVVNSILLLINQLLAQPSGFSDVVNIGGGRPISIKDVISSFETVTNRKAIYRELPSDKRDVAFTSADFTYLSKLTGYVPKVDVTEGVMKFLDWAKGETIQTKMDSWIDSVKE